MAPTEKTTLNISSDAFDEIALALETKGRKINSDENIILTKDIAIKGPINYRQVNLRHQLLIEVVKVYKSPLDADKQGEVNDVNEFLNFFDAVYNYVLKGEKPNQTKPTEWK